MTRRGPDEVQIGTDPRWAVRVRGLAPPQQEALLRVGDRAVDALLPDELLPRLALAGLVQHPPRHRHALPPGTAPDVHGYALADDAGRGDALQLLRRRSRACVSVHGLDRLGVVVASTLATAGVGTVLVEDDRPVGVDDLGGGVRHADLGRRRSHVVADLLRGQSPRVRVQRRSAARPDVVVTVTADACDPSVALGLAAGQVPHLPVVLREADAVVGPFVLPGTAPCLRCVELHRTDLDPAWPTVLAGLLAGRRGTGGAGAPAALAAVAGGLAAAEVLRHLDGGAPCTRGHQYEVPLPSVEPRLRAWAPHPECGCGALPG